MAAKAIRTWLFGCCLAIVVCAVSTPGTAELRTRGPIVEGPLQVGTWAPLASEMPPWVFPMVYHRDSIPPMPVEEYALKFVETIHSFPADRPVWLQTHRWLGNYRPFWDQHNVLAHIADATAEGTPGIWPDRGKAIWLERQRKFLAILREHGCRLDFWPLDHETTVQEWAHNWGHENAFRNIVLDPRWRSERIPGLGLRGIEFLDPVELAAEDGTWRRGGFDNVEDSRLACDAVTVAAAFMPAAVLNEVFVQPVLKAYPHAAVSDYNKTREPITAVIPFVNADAPVPDPDTWDGQRMARMRRFWKTVHQLRPELKEYQGVGTHASPSLYGGDMWRRDRLRYGYRPGEDVTEVMLRYIDSLIARYGGPQQLAPWITLPNYVPSRHFVPEQQGERAMTAEEYQRLIVGLAERGVTKMLLWFNPANMNTPEANQEFRDVIQRAYEAAKARRDQAPPN